MRPIDANALKESVRKKFMALPDRCEVNELVNAAPTVDAIPVEWLKQQFYDNPASQWAEKCRDVFTGWQKWQRLQKEQEAQDEKAE